MGLSAKIMEPGMKKYAKTFLDFIGIYFIGSLNVNAKIPTNIKTYSYTTNSTLSGNNGKSDAKQLATSNNSNCK